VVAIESTSHIDVCSRGEFEGSSGLSGGGGGSSRWKGLTMEAGGGDEVSTHA